MSSAKLQQYVAMIEHELAWARLKIQAPQQELRLERNKKYGSSSETLSSWQAELLDFRLSVSGEAAQSKSGANPWPSSLLANANRIPGGRL